MDSNTDIDHTSSTPLYMRVTPLFQAILHLIILRLTALPTGSALWFPTYSNIWKDSGADFDHLNKHSSIHTMSTYT